MGGRKWWACPGAGGAESRPGDVAPAWYSAIARLFRETGFAMRALSRARNLRWSRSRKHLRSSSSSRFRPHVRNKRRSLSNQRWRRAAFRPKVLAVLKAEWQA